MFTVQVTIMVLPSIVVIRWVSTRIPDGTRCQYGYTYKSAQGLVQTEMKYIPVIGLSSKWSI